MIRNIIVFMLCLWSSVVMLGLYSDPTALASIFARNSGIRGVCVQGRGENMQMRRVHLHGEIQELWKGQSFKELTAIHATLF